MLARLGQRDEPLKIVGYSVVERRLVTPVFAAACTAVGNHPALFAAVFSTGRLEQSVTLIRTVAGENIDVARIETKRAVVAVRAVLQRRHGAFAVCADEAGVCSLSGKAAR